MDKSAHQQIVDDQISRAVNALLPSGAEPVTATRLRTALRDVATVAFREGESYALLSLLTAEDVARELGITPQRVRAIARARHHHGIGWQVPGSKVWLFRPQEVDLLRPGRVGRPRAKRGETP